MIFRVIGLIITWGPIVLSSVKHIEKILNGKTGTEKKEAALSLIKDSLQLRGIEFTEQTKSIASGLIDFIVATLNAWNQWKN
jgi:hypothetical protein